MLEEKLDVITNGSGEIVGIDHQVTTSNLNVRQFAHMVKNIQRSGDNKFLNKCRIVGVIPIILPDGDFKQNQTGLTMDRDQQDWFLKRRPDFNTEV